MYFSDSSTVQSEFPTSPAALVNDLPSLIQPNASTGKVEELQVASVNDIVAGIGQEIQVVERPTDEDSDAEEQAAIFLFLDWLKVGGNYAKYTAAANDSFLAFSKSEVCKEIEGLFSAHGIGSGASFTGFNKLFSVYKKRYVRAKRFLMTGGNHLLSFCLPHNHLINLW